jgi:hypothetical protein
VSALVRIGAAVALFAAVGAAENINVSKIATGTTQSINFTTAASKPFLANVYDLSYNTKALGGISSESSDYYLPTPWTETWQAGKEYPKLQREEPTPAATDDQKYASPFWKLALADMTVSPRLVQSRVFKSGSAKTVTTYSMKVDHFGSPGDYFLTVHVPTFQMSFSTAYSLCCPGDYNGGTYLYKRPNKIRMRAAVDLYIDNLPAWSSEKTYTYAEDLGNNASNHFDTFWDRASSAGTDTLYLGRFNAGDSIKFSWVIRTDVVSDAPNCGDAHIGAGYPKEKRCSDSIAKVTITGGTVPGLGFYVKAP